MNVRALPFLTAALTAISGIAWAQSDPKITTVVTPELVPNEVTLSRNVGSATSEFIGQAAYRVKITMNASNVLSQTLFSARTSVVQAASDIVVAGATAKFDSRVPGATIALAGENPGCSIGADPTRLNCNFGDGTLDPGNAAEFIILVQSPVTGGRIKLDWSFGGEEGNGNGNGCCTKLGTVYTSLIDAAAANSTVKTHNQTFVVKGAITNLFTGVNKGATEDDPWTTIADLGSNFMVGPTTTRTYVQAVIDEKKNLDAGIPSCPAANKNECWQSQLTIVDTTWPLADPLWITLERHSSIIKNGTKLPDYTLGFLYSKTGVEGTFQPILLCADVSGGQPTPGNPCLAPKSPNTTPCVARPDPIKRSAEIWGCTVKAVDNGFIRR